jgi:hypothetical protein
VSTVQEVWPDVRLWWSAKDPGDAQDVFSVDATKKLAEVSGDAVTGVPSLAAYLPAAPTTPVSDLVFGTPAIGPNQFGLAGQVVTFTISGGVAGNVYKVTLTFSTTSRPNLERSAFLPITPR